MLERDVAKHLSDIMLTFRVNYIQKGIKCCGTLQRLQSITTFDSFFVATEGKQCR